MDDIEPVRSRCFDLAASAFSNNMLDLATYDDLAGKIASADDVQSLQQIEQSLPQPAELPETTPQFIHAEMSKVRKTGRWIASSRITVTGEMSDVRLDFMSYRADENVRLHIELDCTGSRIRVIVPRSFEVIEKLESNRMSVFRDKRGSTEINGVIVISGRISSSTVKVKRK